MDFKSIFYEIFFKKWIKETNREGIIIKFGRYEGGTFKAFRFARWLVDYKLNLSYK